ncbi:hypothetical protein OESDEN_03594 [Oesophagostomum dentatum]|uniref:Uncharacterized protein n=1 Tax=Oesophagostomum dentatum TaxID=61180 RepID=A0A0B1TK08_OESDE|nr:hypothetical protein OESDEN_03594 [Oesophagostomum dentatum]
MLQVIDSSGSRDFLAMRHFYIRTGDAFLVRKIIRWFRRTSFRSDEHWKNSNSRKVDCL